MTKAQSGAIGIFVVGAAFIVGAAKFIESVGFVVPAVVLAVIIGAVWLHKVVKKERRLSYLREKYGDEEIAQNMMNQNIWQGQTAGQLLDSIGQPEDIDNKVLKTKKKEIWKYQNRGGNRYGLRITLENDEVVGWDQKS